MSQTTADPALSSPETHAKSRVNRSQLIVVFCAALLTIGCRLVDLPLANLGMMAAFAMLCGTAFRGHYAILLPVAVRVLTDALVHLKTGYGFFESWPFDYSAYLLIYCLGIWLPAAGPRSGSAKSYVLRAVSVILAMVSGIAIYFALSNFGVWLLWPDTYPRTAAGLVDCFFDGVDEQHCVFGRHFAEVDITPETPFPLLRPINSSIRIVSGLSKLLQSCSPAFVIGVLVEVHNFLRAMGLKK